MSRRPLPNDIESLQRLVVEQRAALEAARSTLLSRDVEIEKLKIELARLKRMQFGRSSEQLDQSIAQLELSLEELEASAAETAPSLESPPTVEKAKPARRALPESLRRETIVHAAPCECPASPYIHCKKCRSVDAAQHVFSANRSLRDSEVGYC
jgi:transposase